MCFFSANSLYTLAADGTVTVPSVHRDANSRLGTSSDAEPDEHDRSWLIVMPATSRKSASHWMTLKRRFITTRMSSAIVKTLRLPSILVVVGLKKSCIVNLRLLFTAYSAAGIASSPLCRASRRNERGERYIGLPGRPVPTISRMTSAYSILTNSTRKFTLTGSKEYVPSLFFDMCTSTGCAPRNMQSMHTSPILKALPLNWRASFLRMP
mmetsp:Transcript_41857/g.125255  ORF Transcript_41857/g.125255 Transcript_41857/m.125255 type:complete len:210 (-) Transcript_41857:365-994(-)